MKRAVLVFLKLPTPGKVKTRLARAIGPEEAAKAYKLLVASVFASIKDAPVDTFRILFDPPEEKEAIHSWLAPHLAHIADRGCEIEFLPQSNGDLGHRLDDAFTRTFADGFDHVAAIGTDCIAVAPHHFQKAWTKLETRTDVVFGPADDGGYYLIALSNPHPEIFQNIPWSEPDTLEKSLAAAEAKGLRTSQLETLHDIDDIEDWNRVRSSLDSR